jgi:hypothetical protein
MEPRSSEKPVESRSEGPAASSRPPERKRRFQIVKLEERIAPGGTHGNTNGCHYTGTSHKINHCCLGS